MQGAWTGAVHFFAGLILALALAACGGSGSGLGVNASPTKAITAFSLAGVPGNINETAKTIAVTTPFGTNATSLVATFTTTGISVKVGETGQVSGITANDFTNPVIYTVTAADGSTASYTVTVAVASSTAKALTAYSLNGVTGTINETSKAIGVTMPFGTNVTSLIATFTTTGASVKVGATSQISGTTANDFTHPVIYTVTAADGSTASYTVTVNVALNTAKTITAFSLAAVAGTINETSKTITVTMPFGTNATSLIATFGTSGTSVNVGETGQISGATANNFTNPVIYTVTAADGSTASYTVTVNVAPSTAKTITAFSLAGVTGTINQTGKAIGVTMPFGTDVTSLIATFTTTGTNVKVGATSQVSGITANNFTTPVIYTVTAADGSTAGYTVTVTVALPSQINFADNLTLDQGGFLDIPLHNTVPGDVVVAGPSPVNGTLMLAADARSIRYQSNGPGVGEDRFTLTTQHQLMTVEVHDVVLLVRRTDVRPNFLFVLTDDQNVGMEQALPWTAANIRDQGIDFSNSFVPLSMCCPSRASILTGKYPHNHGVRSNVTAGWGGAPAFKLYGNEQQTIAVWLQQAGYLTALFGKYMNNYPEYAPRQTAPYNSPALVPPGWSEWHGAIDLVPGGDNPYLQFNYGLIENGVEIRYGAQPSDYLGDVLTAKAETFIAGSIRSQKPFFAYVAYVSPHGPATPAPRHAGSFLGFPFAAGPAFNEADISDKPQWLRLNPLLTQTAIQDIAILREKRHESLLSVDEGIQRLFNVLQQSGELSRTYIIFTSDNGWHLGEHQLPPNKGTAYEEDIRVPLWIRGPGIPAGSVNNGLVVNIDLAPTFNELAGIAPQPTVDGRSLVPLLTGPAPSDWRRRFLVEHYAALPNFTPVPVADPGWFEYFGIRDQGRIFVQYSYGDQEYYDLALDPFQLTNTVTTVNPLVVQDLNSRLPALKSCAGVTCRAEESRP